MPKRSSCKAASLYRFEGGLDPTEYILSLVNAEVTDDNDVLVGDTRCRLVAGVLPSDRPSWAGQVMALTGHEMVLPGSSPFAVLIIPLAAWTYAIAWGAGHHLLDDQLVDQGFGLAFGMRRLDASLLGFVASSALDASGRSSQISIPGGTDLGGFGLQPFGDLINRLAGSADLSGLTYHRDTGRSYRIRASDALFMPLPCEPHDLLADLAEIESVVDTPDEDSLLKPAFRIRPVPKNDPHLTELNERLGATLGGDERFGRLGLAWPADAVGEAEEAVSFRTLGMERGPSRLLGRDLELDELLAPFVRMPVLARIERLKLAKLAPCADEDGTELLGGPITLRKWLVFETSIGFKRYCYNQGRSFWVSRNICPPDPGPGG